MPQHSGIAHSLILYPQLQVAFDQPVQGFRRMAGSLVGLDDIAKAVYRRQVIVMPQMIAANFHFLARQVILGQIQLDLRIPGIFRIGKAADYLTQSLHGLFRDLLVAADIGNLLIIAQGYQIIGIRRRFIIRIELGKALQGADGGMVVFRSFVTGESGHNLGVSRPFRGWMLPFHFLERLYESLYL